jgi:hypothetical protein
MPGCRSEAAVDAGLDLTSLSLVANQDDWQWSSDKMGFVYTGAGEDEAAVSASTGADAMEKAADFVKGSSWAQGEIRQLARSQGFKVSTKFVSKEAASVGKVAGGLSKLLAAKSAYERFKKCRGF